MEETVQDLDGPHALPPPHSDLSSYDTVQQFDRIQRLYTRQPLEQHQRARNILTIRDQQAIPAAQRPGNRIFYIKSPQPAANRSKRRGRKPGRGQGQFRQADFHGCRQCIYVIFSTTGSQAVYIGHTKQFLWQRFKEHFYSARQNNPPWEGQKLYRSFRIHGLSN